MARHRGASAALAFAAAFVIALQPVVCGAGPGYYYTTQSFDCSVYEGGGSVFVAQSATLYCFQGWVDTINVTLPYDRRQALGLETTLTVQTGDATEMGWRVDHPGNLTVISTILPQRLYPGEEQTIVAKYTLRDIGSSGGATFGDRLFGREGTNTVIRFRTPLFEAEVAELIVRIYPPVDQSPKDWSPRTDSAKTWRADGRLGIIWHMTSGMPERAQFELVFGEGGWNVTPIDMLGVAIAAFAILLYHRRKKRRAIPGGGE